MNIISFAWTSPAIEARSKNTTRRGWSAGYAAKFKVNSISQAYNKGPRVGGHFLDYIRHLREPWIQNTRDMTEDDYWLEGFSYMERQGMLCRGLPCRQFFEEWRAAAEDLYVVEFTYVDDMTYEPGCGYAGSRLPNSDIPRIPRVLGQLCWDCKQNCVRAVRR